MQAYGVFYKDKHGFECMILDNGAYIICDTKYGAEFKAQHLKDKLRDIMRPRIEYKSVKKFFWSKPEMVEINRTHITDDQRTLLKRQLDTMFVQPISIY